LLYVESFIEPFWHAVVHLLLPIFLFVTKLIRNIPPLAILAGGRRARDDASRDRLDSDRRILRPLRLFLFRLSLAVTCSRCRIARGRIPHLAVAGTRTMVAGQWRPGSKRAIANGRWFSLALGFRGRMRDHRGPARISPHALAQTSCALRRAFDRDLSRLLPADGGKPDTAAARRHHSRYRRDLADRHRRGRRRRACDLARRRWRCTPTSCSNAPDAFWIAPKKARAVLQAAE